MLANANPHVDATPDAIPTDRNVREIIAVCAKHGLDYGRVESFAPFMQALNTDKHLAMTFWAAVARIEKNSGVLPLGVLLEAIVAAVTSKTVEELKAVDPAQQRLLDQLSSLLAGEDLQSPANVTPLQASSEEELAFEVAARKLENARKKLRTGAAKDRLQTPGEPLLTPIRTSALSTEEKPRLVLEPEPELANSKREAPANRPIMVPLAGYTEAAPRSVIGQKTLVAVLILALLGGSSFLVLRTHESPTWHRMGAAMRAGYSSALAVWNGRPSAPSSAASQVESVSPSIPAATTAPTQTTPAATPPPTATAPRPIAVKPITQYHGVPSAAAQTSQASDFGDSDPADSPRTVVRESAMKQYLISSRVPVYPDEARDRGIAGNVVMEAVVSPTGAVEHLHVIDGDPALRRAALEAVSAWHYRPYMVDGQATEVSTTISVYVGPEQQ